jgi:hypothetical protein
MPAVVRDDLLLDVVMPFRIGGQRFEFVNQIGDVLRADADVFLHGQSGIERKFLREITDQQIAPFRDLAGIGLLQIGDDFQQRRFSGAVAPHHSNAVMLVDRQR